MKIETLDDLERLFELTKKAGLEVFTMEGISFKMRVQKSPEPEITEATKVSEPVTQELNIEELVKILNPQPELTSEEILYYAVPYYDELQAEKELKDKKASN